MKDYENNWNITEAMIRFGGSFVSELGTLYRMADTVNQAKLRAAFPNYWKEYAELYDKKLNNGLSEVSTEGAKPSARSRLLQCPTCKSLVPHISYPYGKCPDTWHVEQSA